jgi:hypothetical protein
MTNAVKVHRSGTPFVKKLRHKKKTTAKGRAATVKYATLCATLDQNKKEIKSIG